MSVSSIAGPTYNAFYDNTAESDGESEDSFIVKRRASQANQRKGRNRKDKDDDTLLSAIIKPFTHCCAPFRRSNQQSDADAKLILRGGSSGYYESGGALGGLAAGLVASESGDSDSSMSMLAHKMLYHGR